MKNNKAINFIMLTSVLATVASFASPQPSLTAENSEPTSITLTGTIRDFKAYRLGDRTLNPGGHQDFQRYEGEDGDFEMIAEFDLIADDFLDQDGKPVYKPVSGSTITTTTAENFSQWYRDIPGVNMSMSHAITLSDPDGDGIYSYARDINEAQSFFPIDNLLWGNEGYNHNYHFTYELDSWFTYIPGTPEDPRIFTFKGDDDVFVFIDGVKVIDIGGIHTQKEQSVNLDTLGLTPDNKYELKLFFAERNVTHSNFRVDTNLLFEQEKLFAD
ncbi:MAG: fibro-slime domain-containing protein [Cyanobacteria bacterium P01_C01_bin.72]